MADDVTPSLTAHPSHFPTCTKPESGSHYPSQAECCPKSPVTQRCCAIYKALLKATEATDPHIDFTQYGFHPIWDQNIIVINTPREDLIHRILKITTLALSRQVSASSQLPEAYRQNG
ncbi:hypothetical protein MRX96_003478 [Rhipicephalus microplus]